MPDKIKVNYFDASFRGMFYSLVDFVYKVSAAVSGVYLFFSLMIITPETVAKDGVVAALQDPVFWVVDVFFMYSFVRFWRRRTYTLYDLLIMLYPMYCLFFIITAPNTDNIYFNILFLLVHAVIVACSVYYLKRILDAYVLSFAEIGLFSPAGVISLFNPFKIVLLPYYLMLITVLGSLIYAFSMSGVFVLAVGVLLLGLAVNARLVKILKRLTSVGAKLLLYFDKRNPVLYLRSFMLDNQAISKGNFRFFPRATVEEILAPYSAMTGPFVGIADPGSNLQSLGAAKSRYSEHEWKQAVRDYTVQSQYIIMFAGNTKAIDWELGKIKNEHRDMDLLVLFGVPVFDKLDSIFDGYRLDLEHIKSTLDSEYRNDDVVGAFKMSEDTLALILGDSESEYTYLGALNYFLANRGC